MRHEHYISARGRTLRLRRVRVGGYQIAETAYTNGRTATVRYWAISEGGHLLDTALRLPAARRRARAILET